MPFSAYDPDGNILNDYLESGVTLVVLLATDEECLRKTRQDLRNLYLSKGLKVVYLPIEDFDLPDKTQLESAVREVAAYLAEGGNVAVHCHAGLGRTGVFTACLAKRVMDISGAEAIGWVRRYIPGAIEVVGQEQFVRNL
jgi:protein-tyrosine phosphatase